MKIHNHTIFCLALLAVTLAFPGCGEKETAHQKIEPAHVEHIEASGLSLLTLTEKAVERIGIATTPAVEEMIAHGEARLRMTVPYSALLYDVEGRAWVYVNPKPRTYSRYEVEVDFIDGDKAVLNVAPPLGTQVVSVGAAELYGTEYEVGH